MEPPSPLPVIVVGMHRSGTSATARVVNLLGLATAAEDDLLPPNEGNPEGYWESSTLTDFDDRLLAHLGSSWLAPLPPEQVDFAGLADHRDEASHLLDKFLPPPPWVWKDPRLSVLLGFWRPLVPGAVYVLVHRNALAAAESLARRDGLSVLHGLALWQRYVRSCLTGLEGARVTVVTFEELMNDPRGSVSRLAASLWQLEVQTTDNDEAWRSIREARTDAPRDEGPSEVRSFRRRLAQLDGPHDAFPRSPDLLESSWVEPLLSARRQVSLWTGNAGARN